MCLMVVKSATKEKAIVANAIATNDDNNNEGGKKMQVLLELTKPWYHSNCLITASAYYTLADAAEKMHEVGFEFFGNIKQCSRRFPMEALGYATLSKQGLQLVLAWIDKENSEKEFMAIAWVDHNRHFFNNNVPWLQCLQ
jgi:hypothetical protein